MGNHVFSKCTYDLKPGVEAQARPGISHTLALQILYIWFPCILKNCVTLDLPIPGLLFEGGPGGGVFKDKFELRMPAYSALYPDQRVSNQRLHR